MEKDEKYWESVVEKADEELSELYADRDELTAQLEEVNARILQREQVRAGLERLTAKESRPSVVTVEGVAGLALAEAIRTVLQAIQTHQTAREIRDVLDASGYDLKQHANPLASIHGVLKRLYESSEAVTMESQGKTFYRIAKLKMNRASRVPPIEGLGALKRPSAKDILVRQAGGLKRAPETAVEKMLENTEKEILKRG